LVPDGDGIPRRPFEGSFGKGKIHLNKSGINKPRSTHPEMLNSFEQPLFSHVISRQAAIRWMQKSLHYCNTVLQPSEQKLWKHRLFKNRYLLQDIR
jgi:hypothetical protein